MNPIDRFTTREEVCATHGVFRSTNFVGKHWTSCPHCQDEQRKRDEQAFREENAKRMALEAAQAKQRELEERLRYSGIPPRFKGRTIEGFQAETPEQQRAKDFAAEYARNFAEIAKTGRSALFLGAPGTGKTHLACAIGVHAVNAGFTAMFCTVQRVIRHIKGTWDKNSEATEAEIVKHFTEADFLILDEVGVQFGSETEKNLLFDILNRRYEHMRPTILLSNLNAAGVREYLGERSFDRLREDGGQCITFNWPSHRGGSHVANP